jgi:hypothetical protein
MQLFTDERGYLQDDATGNSVGNASAGPQTGVELIDLSKCKDTEAVLQEAGLIDVNTAVNLYSVCS